MSEQARKMSEIMKEMSETLLRKMPEGKFPKVKKQDGKSLPQHPDEDG